MPSPFGQFIVTIVVPAMAWAALSYFALGLVFGVVFVFKGAAKLDPLAKTGTWGFRLAILPGAIALWFPILMAKRRGRLGPEAQRTPHTLRVRVPSDASLADNG